MSFFTRLKHLFSPPRAKRTARPLVKANYDAAQTGVMNMSYWANADGLSADEANSPEVRRVLRNRAEYELTNNSYLSAMVGTLGAAVIGSGPRLQFQDEDEDVNDQVERLYNDWYQGWGGPDKVLAAYNSSTGKGEAFLIERNSFNSRSPVMLDYWLVDPARCTSGFNNNTLTNIDGVLIDDMGSVTGYTFSRRNPGDRFGIVTLLNANDLLEFPADQVLHFFKIVRPEQHRGIPEITSALPIGSKRRAWVQATLEAAKSAANISGVIHSTGGPYTDDLSDGGETGEDEFQEQESFTLENGQMVIMPKGWDMNQVKAEHPGTTFPEFKKELIAEEARSLGMPYNVAAGTSEGFNFASGRLDSMSFDKDVFIRQSQVNRRINDPMFTRWFREARTIPLFLPEKVRIPGYVPRYGWFYDGKTTIDEQKKANADEKNLRNGVANHPSLYAAQGLDYRTEFKKIAAAKKLADELDITAEVFPEVVEEPVPASAEEIAQAVAEQGLTL